jgi:hypothetical protein
MRLKSLLTASGVLLSVGAVLRVADATPTPRFEDPIKTYNLASVIWVAPVSGSCASAAGGGSFTVTCPDVAGSCSATVHTTSTFDPFDTFERDCDGHPVLIESGNKLHAYGTQTG